MSKFPLDVLEKRVYPFASVRDDDVILGASFGEDIALTRVGGDILVSHVDPIVGAMEDIGWLAVQVACNDIATSGGPPRWILLLVLVPRREDEELLEEIMRSADRAAKEIGVSIIGGHTGYSSGILRPLVAVTALGTLAGREPVRTRGAKPGDRVLITKGIGLEGTAILAGDFASTARKLGLSNRDLQEGRRLLEQVSVIPEALALARAGATALHDVTRGGALETLLEIARLSGVGMEIDFSKIPIPPVVERFARAFKFDPLRMISSGTLAATVPPGRLGSAIRALREQGIAFSDVGEVVEGAGVDIRRGDQFSRYREVRSEDDELARIWAEHNPDK
jgi:hydrogenase expression/formation protein HypE